MEGKWKMMELHLCNVGKLKASFKAGGTSRMQINLLDSITTGVTLNQDFALQPAAGGKSLCQVCAAP